jgi:tetraacyldisaccharide 4'-kinase
VAHLAARLNNPAILTRGYRRESREMTIVPRGGNAPVRDTGDEPQWFIRRQVAHVGIGADRFAVGRRMEQDLRPGVFLLDDGFQHFRLKRDEDIVLVDALDPLGGGLFPLGHRREPLEGLARATIIVISRAEHRAAGIEKMIRRYNRKAPIFRSRVVPAPLSAGARRVGAFCGIGSPRSFWRTLGDLHLEVVWRQAFRDHYSYRGEDLARISAAAQAAGAEALVTTEKDLVNISEQAAAAAAPLAIHGVRIEVEIENEAGLLERLR